MEFTGEFFIPGKTEKRIQEDHSSRYEFAKKYVAGARVLDIACGVGYGSQILNGLYKTYTGVDINEEEIKFAQKNYARDNAKFILGNICNFNDVPYDVIISFETIEHVRCYKTALLNLYSNLKQNGVLIISSPNRIVTSPEAKSINDKPANKFHTQEFTPAELIKELTIVGFDYNNIFLFGQRQALPFSNRWLKKIYYHFFNPSFNSSPEVTPVKSRFPRYFILVAKK